MITSQPHGVTITLNGQEVGTTPVRVKLPTLERNEIVATMEGYQPAVRHLPGIYAPRRILFLMRPAASSAGRGEGQQVQQMQQMSGPTVIISGVGGGREGTPSVRIEESGTLSVTTTPPEAEILLDDRVIGTSPARNLKVPAGDHAVKAVKAGYEAATKEITVIANQALELTFNLTAKR
ncbi:MAG: PEGA domain-containing protein [bacterium]|nr:PEGA domain-containing protein [bacterium]